MAYLDPNGAYGAIQGMGDAQLAQVLQPGSLSNSQVPASLALYELQRRRQAAMEGETPKALADQSYFSNLRNPASYAKGGIVGFDSGGPVPVNSAFQDPTMPVSDADWNSYLSGLKSVESPGQGYGITGGANGAYSGAYQMGDMALVDAGFLKPGGSSSDATAWTGLGGIKSKNDFLQNPQAQKFAAEKLASLNYRRLQKNGGITAGMTQQQQLAALAAAHGLGANGSLRPGARDAFGTPASTWANAQNTGAPSVQPPGAQSNPLLSALGIGPNITGAANPIHAAAVQIGTGAQRAWNDFNSGAGPQQRGPMATQRGTVKAPVTPAPNSTQPIPQPGVLAGPGSPGAAMPPEMYGTPPAQMISGDPRMGGTPPDILKNPNGDPRMQAGIASPGGHPQAPQDPMAFDRNQFLINAGLALAASNNPHFFGALGEAGQQGMASEVARRSAVVGQMQKRQEFALEAAKLGAPGDQQKLFAAIGDGDVSKGAQIFFDRSRYSPEQIASQAVASFERDNAQSGGQALTQDEWNQRYQAVLQMVISGRAQQQGALTGGGINSLPGAPPGVVKTYQ